MFLILASFSFILFLICFSFWFIRFFIDFFTSIFKDNGD